MRDHFEMVSYVLSNLFRIYSMYLFSNAYYKRQIKVRRNLIIIFFFAYYTINTIGNLFCSNVFLNLFTNIIPFFLLSLLYEASMLKRVIAVFISYAASLCIDAFLVSIEFLVGAHQVVISSGIATSFFIFLAERVYEYFTDKNVVYPELKRKQLLLILTIPIGSVVIAVRTMQERDYNYLLESSILFLMNAVVFYMYDSLMKTSHAKFQAAVLEEQNRSYANQLEIYKESTRNDRILQHDMKNHIHQIQFYANHGQVEELKIYIDAIIHSVGGNDMIFNTGNQEIDCILNFKAARWKQLNAEVHTDLEVPTKINIDNFDLIKILGNLFDNVSDAIEKIEHRIVYVRIHYEKGLVNICIRNTYDGNLVISNGKPITKKKEESSHGFGLQSIEEAVKKYDGEIDFDYTDKVFSTFVILYEL